jgi:uncharacterized protein (DUF1499 family)
MNWMLTGTTLAIAAALGVAIFFAVGPATIWQLFGPADLGSITFETLERRKSPNDALASPANFTRAQSDVTPPIFELNAVTLRAALDKAIATEPNVVRMDRNDATLTDRYVQRTSLMQYPDTIVVRLIDVGEGRATVAIYSRSHLGHSDLGANLARIKRWLEKLKTEVRSHK